MVSNIVKIMGYAGGITSIIILIITLCFSMQHDYKIILLTNTFNECHIEIIILTFVLLCLLYIFKMDKWNE
jgi:uncharacterized membrane protein